MSKDDIKGFGALALIIAVVLFGLGGCYHFQASRFNDNYGTHFTWYDIMMGLHKQYRGIGQP